MNLDTPPLLLFLLFFSLFHIPGGFVVGRGLRQIFAAQTVPPAPDKLTVTFTGEDAVRIMGRMQGCEAGSAVQGGAAGSSAGQDLMAAPSSSGGSGRHGLILRSR